LQVGAVRPPRVHETTTSFSVSITVVTPSSVVVSVMVMSPVLLSVTFTFRFSKVVPVVTTTSDW